METSTPEDLPQEQVPVIQEKQVEDTAEVFGTKVPQNSHELLLYTPEKNKRANYQ